MPATAGSLCVTEQEVASASLAKGFGERERGLQKPRTDRGCRAGARPPPCRRCPPQRAGRPSRSRSRSCAAPSCERGMRRCRLLQEGWRSSSALRKGVGEEEACRVRGREEATLSGPRQAKGSSRVGGGQSALKGLGLRAAAVLSATHRPGSSSSSSISISRGDRRPTRPWPLDDDESEAVQGRGHAATRRDRQAHSAGITGTGSTILRTGV
jgi:hypothetical protein